MCIASIALLEETWGSGVARVGRLDNGGVVSLAFVPEAKDGDRVLVHLGVPVEVLGADDDEGGSR